MLAKKIILAIVLVVGATSAALAQSGFTTGAADDRPGGGYGSGFYDYAPGYGYSVQHHLRRSEHRVTR